MPAAFSALFALSANVAIGLCACAFRRTIPPTGASPRRTREPAWSAPPRGNGCCPARTPCRIGFGGVSVPAEPGTESVPDCFLGYSYVSFLFCALLWRTFFLSNGTKKAPRAVRGSSSVSFDGMILSHFCSVCIRVFRQGSVDVLLSCETHYYLTFPLYLQPHQRSSPASAISRTPSCHCTLRKQSSRS